MSKKSDLAKNTFVIAAGKLSTQFLAFFLLPVYTIFLTPSEFGQLDLILIYVALLAPVFTVQMEMAVFRHLIDARGDKSRTAQTIASSSAVGLVGLFIGAVSIGIFGFAIGVAYTWLLMGFFVSIAVANYLLQVVRGLGRNDIFAVASICIGLTNIGATLALLIVFGWGIEGVLAASILANVVGSIFLVTKERLYQYVGRGVVNRNEARKLLDYAWPLVPNHVSLWGINGLSRTIVVTVLGFAAMGIFAAAARFPLIYTSLFGIFLMSWTEAASLHIKDKKDDFFSSTTDSAVRIFGGLSLLIIAGISLVFPLFVASEFADARQYIPVLLIGAFLSSIVAYYGAIYLAVRKTKDIMVITIQAIIVSSILTLATIGLIGLYAPALALVVTYSYLAVRRHFDVQQYATIRYNKYTFLGLVALAVPVIALYHADTTVTSIVSVVVAVGGFMILNRSSIKVMRNVITGKLGKTKSKRVGGL